MVPIAFGFGSASASARLRLRLGSASARACIRLRLAHACNSGFTSLNGKKGREGLGEGGREGSEGGDEQAMRLKAFFLKAVVVGDIRGSGRCPRSQSAGFIVGF